MKINDLTYLQNIDASEKLEGGVAISSAFPVTAIASGPNFSSTAITAGTSATTALVPFVPGVFIGANTSTAGGSSFSASS